MSRVGKEPINIPDNVRVEIKDQKIKVIGPKGELERIIHPRIKVEIENGTLFVKRYSDDNFQKSLHGLYRSLINNMIIGVTNGFSKSLEVVGVGYKVEKKGSCVIFNLGFSHPIIFSPPKEINMGLRKRIIDISGIDKELVGQVAAKIRSFKPPEPYKGKGIRYVGEEIKRKAGKAAV